MQLMEVVAEGVMLVWWGGWRVAARGMHWERVGEEGRMHVTPRCGGVGDSTGEVRGLQAMSVMMRVVKTMW